jgi:pimeloyl-[acyl-carrier protein] methyl ester esterase
VKHQPKRTVLLLAGWGHAKQSLDAIERELIEDFDVRSFDLRDFDPLDTGPSWAARATTRGPLVVGWSLGGTVALELAARPGARVQGLVLIGCVSRLMPNRDGRFGRTELDPDAILDGLRRDPRALLARFFRATAFPAELSADRLESRIDEAMSLGVDALARGMHYLRATDVSALARSLDLPAMVLHGKEDSVMPWRSGRLLARALRSRWTLCDGVGHDLPVREPALVWTAVRDLARRAR